MFWAFGVLSPDNRIETFAGPETTAAGLEQPVKKPVVKSAAKNAAGMKKCFDNLIKILLEYFLKIFSVKYLQISL
jgi:hypothetical protein